ncbi:hypothetical protein F4859DRAFT_457820 [Xylaria cf. heliscus]|nr:hypothetical protein F4859DRAFT_457820 [Xylaria cf. heliscus]
MSDGLCFVLVCLGTVVSQAEPAGTPLSASPVRGQCTSQGTGVWVTDPFRAPARMRHSAVTPEPSTKQAVFYLHSGQQRGEGCRRRRQWGPMQLGRGLGSGTGWQSALTFSEELAWSVTLRPIIGQRG